MQSVNAKNDLAQNDERSSVNERRKHGSLRGQFGNPSGVMGSIIGRLMAQKNAYIQELAASALKVQPTDRILEIGFGSGLGVQLVAKQATSGLVGGVDHSDTMVRQASQRNRKAVREGRVELKQGSSSKLSFDDASFDKVWEANSFHHWPSQEEGLGEVRRVLKDGGLLMLCLRMKAKNPGKLQAPGHTTEEVEQTKETVARCGFKDVRTEIHHLERDVTLLFANK